MTPSIAATDLVDALVPLPEGSAAHQVRHQRAKVVTATQGSYDSIFDPALSSAPALAERLLAAHAIARLAGSDVLQSHYRERLQSLALTPVQRAAHQVRHQRAKVVTATQGSYDSIFDPALGGAPALVERLLVAHAIAGLAGSIVLQNHYRERLQSLALTPVQRAALAGEPLLALDGGVRLQALLAFAQTLTERPVEGDQAALLALPAAGLTTPEVVSLAQLIAFVAYQLRVVAGLQALAELGDDIHNTPPAADAAAALFVHPANLPAPGEPVRVNGYTSETLDWKAWLPLVDLDLATPAQLAVLSASHPKAKESDYYRVLAHQPRILEERSIVFNAIMYAPGGLSRAERELASAVVSRVNGCVYCASVHAQRFEQLTKRNDVICQVFAEPQGAGTTARERAIVQLSIDLTAHPAGFGAAQLQAVRAAGLSNLEVLDLVHAVAIFAWANRLMLNLGEAVVPVPAAAA